jgi:hypothetical protein
MTPGLDKDETRSSGEAAAVRDVLRELREAELEALAGVGVTDIERELFTGRNEAKPAPVCAMPGCDELARSCSWCWTHCRATHRHPKPGEER